MQNRLRHGVFGLFRVNTVYSYSTSLRVNVRSFFLIQFFR
nr:MAG TPA: hypothetical protein [Caudoviricetes sp.]